MTTIKLRPEQVAVFAADMKRRCVVRLARHLRAACPAETAGVAEDDLRRAVSEGMAHGERHGLVAEGDLAVFLECRLELGADFDVRPGTAWAGAVLRDGGLFPHEKASYLADRHMMARGGKGSA